MKRALWIFTFILICFTQVGQSQDVHKFIMEGEYQVHCLLMNPSFEERAAELKDLEMISYWNGPIPSWKDCGVPGHTPPTHHYRDSVIFNVTKLANDGESYVSMVVRSDMTWERMSQRLDVELKAGEKYILGLYICFSDELSSPTREDQVEPTSFAVPVVLRFYGGQEECTTEDLLFESKTIDNTDWEELVVTMNPEKDVDHITIEAYYSPEIEGVYNGNVMIDHLSAIYKIMD